MSDTPQIQTDVPTEDGPDGDNDPEGDSDGFASSLPRPSLSRRQGLMLAALAAVLIALYLAKKRSDNSTPTTTKKAREELKNTDTSSPVEHSDDSQKVAIEVPTSPDAEIEKDQAILDSSVFKVVGGGD